MRPLRAGRARRDAGFARRRIVRRGPPRPGWLMNSSGLVPGQTLNAACTCPGRAREDPDAKGSVRDAALTGRRTRRRCSPRHTRAPRSTTVPIRLERELIPRVRPEPVSMERERLERVVELDQRSADLPRGHHVPREPRPTLAVPRDVAPEDPNLRRSLDEILRARPRRPRSPPRPPGRASRPPPPAGALPPNTTPSPAFPDTIGVEAPSGSGAIVTAPPRIRIPISLPPNVPPSTTTLAAPVGSIASPGPDTAVTAAPVIRAPHAPVTAIPLARPPVTTFEGSSTPPPSTDTPRSAGTPEAPHASSTPVPVAPPLSTRTPWSTPWTTASFAAPGAPRITVAPAGASAGRTVTLGRTVSGQLSAVAVPNTTCAPAFPTTCTVAGPVVVARKSASASLPNRHSGGDACPRG